MSFQQGLSGLNAAANNLSVIGNNVANASTVGFKAAQAQFADVYANSLQGGGAVQIGIGTQLTRVQQQFSQGNITGSSNPLDVAINGKGFFRMSDSSGAITYSRNGQFQLDKNGQLMNASGQYLTGYALGPNGLPLNGGAPSVLTINTADLAPVATTTYGLTMNLDSRSLPITVPFDPNNPATYHRSVPVPVYDSLGNASMLQTFYVNRGPDTTGTVNATGGNVWDVYAVVTYPDGTSRMVNAAGVDSAPGVEGAVGAERLGQLAFSPSGALVGIGGAPAVTPLTLTFQVNDGSDPMSIDISHMSSTQFGSAMSVTAQNQNGYTSGSLTGFSFAEDGTIVGRYSNGKTNVLGQVALVNFANPNGLQNLGGNQFAETADSGVPVIGVPGSSGLGVLQASATEDSNVDLTAELVNMITAQRNYQANAQTIKTQDQVMQTIVNLR